MQPLYRVLFAVICMALGSVFPGTAHALCASPRDMTAIWTTQRGVYHVRQIGNEVYWVGMSNDGGKSWMHVFRGTKSGNIVTGTWADVPPGHFRNSGTLSVRVDGTNGVLGFTRTAATGGFGDSRWGLSCEDVVLNPVGR
jgi:hypothetical protein